MFSDSTMVCAKPENFEFEVQYIAGKYYFFNNLVLLIISYKIPYRNLDKAIVFLRNQNIV